MIHATHFLIANSSASRPRLGHRATSLCCAPFFSHAILAEPYMRLLHQFRRRHAHFIFEQRGAQDAEETAILMPTLSVPIWPHRDISFYFILALLMTTNSLIYDASPPCACQPVSLMMSLPTYAGTISSIPLTCHWSSCHFRA